MHSSNCWRTIAEKREAIQDMLCYIDKERQFKIRYVTLTKGGNSRYSMLHWQREAIQDMKKNLKIRYQRGNQNPYIEKQQKTQWSKEKVPKDKQRSTKHTLTTKDRLTRTPLKNKAELGCSGRVGSSCSTSGTRRVNLVTNPVISHEWGKNREVLTTSGTYPWTKDY